MPAQLSLTVDEVYDAAQAVFEAGERVDMGQLAVDLGMAKATLYRWVGSREDLLSQVLVRLAHAAFDAALANAAETPAQGRFEMIARTYIGSIVGMEPLAAFIRAEGPLALRLITTRGGTVQRAVTDRLEAVLLAEESAGGVVLHAPVHDLAYAMARLTEGFIYNDQAAEITPDVDAAVRILMLLVR